MMPELVGELRVLVVGGFEESVLHAEGVPVVLAERVAGDLHDPAIQVLSIERLNPVLAVRVVLSQRARGRATSVATHRYQVSHLYSSVGRPSCRSLPPAGLQMGQNGSCNGGSNLLVRLFLGLGAAAWCFRRRSAGRFQSRRASDSVRQLLRLPRSGRQAPRGKPAPGYRRGPVRRPREPTASSRPATPRRAASWRASAPRRRPAACRRRRPAPRSPPRRSPPSANGSSRARSGSATGPSCRRSAPRLPAVKNEKWARNPIDRFVLARLEREGLKPSPEADRATLLRRLSFDLTGLPPTPAEVDAFLADKSADAYEKQVDRLLALPQYGERMAMQWLDLARYADTHGYHIDSEREHVAVARLGDRRLQPQHAVRPVHHRATGRRPAAQRHRASRNSPAGSTATT